MARLVYLGTPEAAVPPLRTLVDAGHDVALVVSRADKRRGRGSDLVPSPVKAAAMELGLPVTASLDDVASSGAELGVVVAYGRIIPSSVLDVVPMVNLHFSLLPRWRGAAPVERAILEGDAETGVCLMAVEKGLDTGPIYAVGDTGIDEQESVEELRARLVEIGCRLLVENLADGTAGLPVPHDQVGDPSYAEKIRPEELELRWERDANHLARVVRLGRAWTTFRGRRLRVLEAAVEPWVRAEAAVAGEPVDGSAVGGAAGADATAGRSETAGADARAEATGAAAPEGASPGALVGQVVTAGEGTRLRLLRVQPEGKQPMAASDWLRGARPQAGELLGG
ncbi:MAG TPA: methionyl-tRNA formyltransferase [Acidimicrobiales bacterium]|nr:methionyl-tRNA formyltransferase [Acidimicrobiales bacterium]